MFDTTPKELSDLYTLLEIKKQKLDFFRPLSSEQSKNLQKVYDVDMTYHSNALEGNTLSYSETKLILEEGITINGKSMNEHLEVINHKEALDFIEELVTIPTQNLRESDILNIHRLILKSINSKEAGRYRTQAVGVRKSDGDIYHFTDPIFVKEKMEEFVIWLQNSNDLNSIQRASQAHFRFVSIHPFIDGNGRTARLIMNLILMQNGYVPSIIRVQDRSEYIQSIEKAQNNEPLDTFHKFIADSVEKNLDFYLETLETNIKFI